MSSNDLWTQRGKNKHKRNKSLPPEFAHYHPVLHSLHTDSNKSVHIRQSNQDLVAPLIVQSHHGSKCSLQKPEYIKLSNLAPPVAPTIIPRIKSPKETTPLSTIHSRQASQHNQIYMNIEETEPQYRSQYQIEKLTDESSSNEKFDYLKKKVQKLETMLFIVVFGLGILIVLCAIILFKFDIE